MEIWSDNPVEAQWFMQLDDRLLGSKIKNIGARGTNPAIIESLVSYDRPDIILLKGDNPIVVVEKTREVPTGHNVGQRIARIARAAELGIPVIFFLPFSARKHGTHTNVCEINARVLTAMRRMTDIHDVPVLAVNWPSRENGELIISGAENRIVGQLIGSLLDYWPERWSPPVIDHLAWLATEEQLRIDAFPNYGNLPASAIMQKTQDFLHSNQLQDGPRSPLEDRTESLVYRIGMSPEKCRRQDPYTGTQFIYDYGWLREGPSPAQRSANLILHVPNVDRETWEKNNPNDPNSKSCNWYLIADAIVLSDGIIDLHRDHY